MNDIKLNKIVEDVGIDLSLVISLVNFLEASLNNEISVSYVDISNLVVVLKQLINVLNYKYENIEQILNI